MVTSSTSLSIIVPVYNAEPYLEQCLESLVNQTFADIEIICVDDGSIDDSLRIMETFAKRDSRIRIVSQKNFGVSVARNMALDIAQGEYIMFVDCDDWIDLDTCETAIKASLQYDADVIMWDYILEYPNVSKKKGIFHKDIIFEEDQVKEKLYYRMIGLSDEELKYPERADSLCPVCMKLYRRRCIEEIKIRFYDIKKIGSYEDGLFNLNVFSRVKRAVYLHKYFYHYRKGMGGTVTSTYRNALVEQWNAIFLYLEKHIIENNLGKEAWNRLNNKVALSILGLGLNVLSGKGTGFQKIREIKKILDSKRFREAYKQLTLKYFPIHWKVFYGFAKFRVGMGTYAVLHMIRRMKGR